VQGETVHAEEGQQHKLMTDSDKVHVHWFK